MYIRQIYFQVYNKFIILQMFDILVIIPLQAGSLTYLQYNFIKSYINFGVNSSQYYVLSITYYRCVVVQVKKNMKTKKTPQHVD